MSLDSKRDQVHEILTLALGLPADRRSEFVGESCANDAEMAREVERLLAESADLPTELHVNLGKKTYRQGDSDTGCLEVRCPNCHSPTEVAVDTRLTDLTCDSCGSHFSLVDQSMATRMAPPLTKLGRFELIERLGVGGFGTVWKARDKELDRTVAIKIPRQGGVTAEEQEKFFREARAAAQLRHPNIVSVHEVGRDGDSIYIVSDFVRGVTLGDWLTGQQLTSREAATLCVKIAEALQHAHEQGVVHRDLKPANIMIDGDGKPHLMDFGLARREVGEVTVTMDGQILGTPAYMSPEQAQGEAHTADRRSDVYSLGVILFQLLTGELPFRGNARMLVHQVINEEPPSPRKLNGNVSKDLETIVLKCLEKKPDERYQSAEEFADELNRWLNGEPIRARPLGAAARSWRWSKRRPAVAALLALLIGSMVFGTSISTFFAIQAGRERKIALAAAESTKKEWERAEQQRASADKSRKNTEIQLQRNRLLQARLQIETGDLAGARLTLLQPIDSSVEEEWRWTAWQYFRRNPETERLDIAKLLLLDHRLAPSRSGGRGLILKHYGRPIVVLAQRNNVRYAIDLTTRQKLPDDQIPELPVVPLALKLAGDLELKLKESATEDTSKPGSLILENEAGETVWQETEPIERVKAMAVQSDLRRVALGLGDGKVLVFELTDTEDAPSLRLVNTLRGSDEEITSLMFDSSGEELFGLSGDWVLRSWAWRAMPDTTVTPTETNTVRRLRYSRSGKLLASGSYDGKVIVWDTQTHARKMEIDAHPHNLSRFGSLEFFDKDQQLLSSGPDAKEIKVWNVSTGELVDTLSTAADTARFVLAADDTTLFVGVRGTVDQWDLATRTRKSRVSPDGNENAYIYNVAYQDSSDRLFTIYTPDDLASTDYKHRRCEIWDGSDMELLGFVPHTHEIGLRDVDLSASGALLGLCARDGAATIWDWESKKLVHTLAVKDGSAHSNIVSAIRFSPQDDCVVTVSHDNHVIFWSQSTGEELARIKVDEYAPISYGSTGALKECAFSPDGKTLAITVASDIWWLDLGYYDEQVDALRSERNELTKSGAPIDLAAVQSILNLITLKNRATRLAESGDFAESASIRAQIRQSDPDSFDKWRDEAFALVAAGDDGEYRRFGDEMMEHFQSKDDATTAAWIIYCCARRPVSEQDFAEWQRLSEICAKQFPALAALVDLRLGRFREAAELLLVAEQWSPLDRDQLPVLAMAYHGLGQKELARDVLRESRDLNARIMLEDPMLRHVSDTIVQEANALIGNERVESIDEGLIPLGEDGKPLNLDFETGTLDDWTIDGKAFEAQPVDHVTVPDQDEELEIGQHGTYWIRTLSSGSDAEIGELVSKPFEVSHPWASFLFGGCRSTMTRVEIRIHDTREPIYSFNGADRELMTRIVVPMKAHLGKKIVIRLVDNIPGGHSHVNFDNFRFHPERPGRAAKLPGKSSTSPSMNWKVQFFALEDLAWADEAKWKAAIAEPPIATQSAKEIDVDWGASGPTGPDGPVTDHFATVAVAKADVPAGEYLIATLSDDGVRLFIDGKLVIDNWINHAPNTDIATIHLTAGEHSFRIEHFDSQQGASLRFRIIPVGELGLDGLVENETP